MFISLTGARNRCLFLLWCEFPFSSSLRFRRSSRSLLTSRIAFFRDLQSSCRFFGELAINERQNRELLNGSKILLDLRLLAYVSVDTTLLNGLKIVASELRRLNMCGNSQL